ncbi:MAG: hypothetical protein IJE50_02165 [Clostridia bacterium]|nr:hypothetical protein [Clostridia bacterium]
MKSKRLLVFIAIVAVILVIMIVLSAVFSIKSAWVVIHRFDGTENSVPPNAPTIQDILDVTEGKNIIFLSKSETLKSLQTDDWHAVQVVKTFPNKITVHFIERALAVKIVVSGQDIYIDSKGNVMPKQENATCINISSAFDLLDVASQEVNQPLKFNSEKNNQRLQQILQVVMAVWRCKVELPDAPAVLGESNVFTYNESNLVIKMPSGAKIVVYAPENNLEERMLSAFSVYFNANNKNLQQDGVIITVREDGKITTDK